MRNMTRALLFVLVVTLSGCPSLGTLFTDRNDLVVDYDIAYTDDGTTASISTPPSTSPTTMPP